MTITRREGGPRRPMRGLSTDLIRRIAEEIRGGATIPGAARVVGVGGPTIYRWMSRATMDDALPLELELAAAVRAAEAARGPRRPDGRSARAKAPRLHELEARIAAIEAELRGRAAA